ncbi:MAG: DUF2332 family protein [Pseudomonadota bacterium]
MAIPPESVREAFLSQARACDALGSPFMGSLMACAATNAWPEGRVTQRIFGWPGDIGPAAQSVPLRFAGALHALKLLGDAQLRQVYPPARLSGDELWAAVSQVLLTEADSIERWLDRSPQTNEVRRSATLIPAGAWLANRFSLPIRTSELGASGGLNLHWDSYGLLAGVCRLGPSDPALILTPEWRGEAPLLASPQVIARGGVDLSPLNPRTPEDALRLRAYLWPDQPKRMALTEKAITAAKTPVEKGDAIDWLAGRLDHHPGTLHLIYSTVAWQYFPAEKQREGRAIIEASGARATEDSPLAWFSMEADGAGKGAALDLRLWPGDLQLSFGRADFHGRWVDWRMPS